MTFGSCRCASSMGYERKSRRRIICTTLNAAGSVDESYQNRIQSYLRCPSCIIDIVAGKATSVRAVLPDIWELVRPRRGLLGLGLVLMAVNRVSGLVLPASTKFLIDDVIGKREASLLLPL